jgi:hypothetical protein
MAQWRLHEDHPFLELIDEQKSDAWFKARELKLSASLAGEFLGFSLFTTPEKALAYLLGEAKRITNQAMKDGCVNEEPLRQRYAHENGVEVIEASFCIPLLDLSEEVTKKYGSMFENEKHPNWFLGVSPDGFVGEDGLLEIKYTQKIYPKLARRALKRKENGSSPKITYDIYISLEGIGKEGKEGEKEGGKEGGKWGREGKHPDHIFPTHYMQMQYLAAVTGRSFIDYYVGDPKGEVYQERIPFDLEYWYDYLYPELIDIITQKIMPKLSPKQLEEHVARVRQIIQSLTI